MTPLIEGITQTAVIAFYVGALVMSLMAYSVSTLWARKLSSFGIATIAAGWLFFYTAIVDPLNFAEVHGSVLWSRVFHYSTATWLYVMALVIWRSEKVHRFLPPDE